MPAKTLYQCALKCLTQSWNQQSLSDITCKTTPAMKSDIIELLRVHILFQQIYTFLTSSNRVFEDLFRSEWYLQTNLSRIHQNLDDYRYFPSIFTFFNKKCSMKLRHLRHQYANSVEAFLRYSSIPVNYALYLVDRGYYYKAIPILEGLLATIKHFEDNISCQYAEIRLHHIKIVAITALFNCYNTLYDISQGESIYAMKTDILRPIHNSGYGQYKQQAALYLTECSKFAQIKSQINCSYDLVNQALQLLDSVWEEEPHPKIVINTLCQAMWCSLNRCDFLRAKLCIDEAVKLARTITTVESMIYFDCLLHYGSGYLHSTDQLHDGHRIMEYACMVSLTFVD